MRFFRPIIHPNNCNISLLEKLSVFCLQEYFTFLFTDDIWVFPKSLMKPNNAEFDYLCLVLSISMTLQFQVPWVTENPTWPDREP